MINIILQIIVNVLVRYRYAFKDGADFNASQALVATWDKMSTANNSTNRLMGMADGVYTIIIMNVYLFGFVFVRYILGVFP